MKKDEIDEMLNKLVIALSNKLAALRRTRVVAKELLLLIPHCLQHKECRVNVSEDIGNCKRCGRCGIAGICELRDEHNLPVVVASGGRQACQAAQGKHVRVVVAIACEKELSAGIWALFPKPVYAIRNLQPCGPCVNTGVEIAETRKVLERILRRDR